MFLQSGLHFGSMQPNESSDFVLLTPYTVRLKDAKYTDKLSSGARRTLCFARTTRQGLAAGGPMLRPRRPRGARRGARCRGIAGFEPSCQSAWRRLPENSSVVFRKCVASRGVLSWAVNLAVLACSSDVLSVSSILTSVFTSRNDVPSAIPPCASCSVFRLGHAAGFVPVPFRSASVGASWAGKGREKSRSSRSVKPLRQAAPPCASGFAFRLGHAAGG